MSLTYRRIFGVTLSAVALSLLASQANAQSSEGTFQIVSETHWGQATLEPGQYHIRISGASPVLSDLWRITLKSENTEINLFGMISPKDEPGTRSYLKLESLNGMSFVHELDSAALGGKFVFAAPKIRHESVSLGQEAEKKIVAVLILPAQNTH